MAAHDENLDVEGPAAAAEAVAGSTPEAALSTALRELAAAREGLAEVRTDDGELLPIELDEARRQLAVAEAALQRVEQDAETERGERTADLQRLAADFDNYRKRVAREQAALVERAHEKLVRELLPVLDGLELALEAANDHEEAKLEEGVDLVHRQLRDLLTREGLAEIATDGAFDPHEHEALLSQPAEAEEGSILQVMQKGYRLGDRVLRPARVVVAGPPPEA